MPQIEGKGLGLVATKFIKSGTLILKEKPQMPYVDNPQLWPDSLKDYCKKVMSLFNQMSESDQEEFQKLHINHENESVKMIRHFLMKIETDQDKTEKILKIVVIYLTNTFDGGLCIKSSRLNHSCFPNAVIGGSEIWATYDIKEGQEITINYQAGGFLGMRKRKYRQKILNDNWNFTCSCDLCKKQDHVPTGIEAKIEELIEEIEKLYVDEVAARKSHPTMAILQYPPEKCRRQIDCYKKLYKFGKEKKVHHFCLYQILIDGFKSARNEYLICEELKKHEFLEEFKKEAVNFAKKAEGFGKLLGEEFVKPEIWKKQHQNFEKYIMELRMKIGN